MFMYSMRFIRMTVCKLTYFFFFFAIKMEIVYNKQIRLNVYVIKKKKIIISIPINNFNKLIELS